MLKNNRFHNILINTNFFVIKSLNLNNGKEDFSINNCFNEYGINWYYCSTSFLD
jgi:hypothetical protein